MLHIKKGSPPASFINYTKTRAEDPKYRPTFDDMPKKIKDDLRSSLLKEQGFLCAYCMKPLADSGADVKIEHYEPRNADNELEYGNLLAVCYGGEGKSYESQTCDTHKGGARLSINPQKFQHVLMLSYRNDGKICISDEVMQNDLDNILNLNVESILKSRRKLNLPSKDQITP